MDDKRHTSRRRQNTHGADTPGDDAALHEARRILEARARVPGELRESLATLADWFRLSLGLYPHEVFAVAWLDRDQCLIRFCEFPFGTTFPSEFDQREIMRSALACDAVTAVLAHNHTFGRFDPATYDNTAVASLTHAFGLVGIRVRDHLVVNGAEPPVSMAKLGLVDGAGRRLM